MRRLEYKNFFKAGDNVNFTLEDGKEILAKVVGHLNINEGRGILMDGSHKSYVLTQSGVLYELESEK